MITELWLPIEGYEGIYEVSSRGRVRSLAAEFPMPRGGVRYAPECLLKHFVDRYGYPALVLTRNGRRQTTTVHRLVAKTFLADSRFAGAEVCHNDGNPTNNDVSNLRWDTRSANHIDSVEHGTDPHRSKTHCKWGHAFTSENTIQGRNQNGRPCRRCRECKRSRDRTRYLATYQQLPAKTHCPQGHPYSGDNLFVNNKGSRECRTCMRARDRRRRSA